MEALELVGPVGPSPSPVEEQDVVLELGNLWYNRYILCDEQVHAAVFLHSDAGVRQPEFRHYSDNRQYSAQFDYLLFPLMPSDFTGTVSGPTALINRRHRKASTAR